MNHKVIDVTKEYEKKFLEQGEILYEEGYISKIHVSELIIAEWIRDTFGGKIILLTESTKEGIRTPDYLWNGEYWELKNIASDKYGTIDKRIRKAYSQIRENRGGIILDFTDSLLDFDKIVKFVKKSAKDRGCGTSDIIVKKGKQYEILRIIKE